MSEYCFSCVLGFQLRKQWNRTRQPPYRTRKPSKPCSEKEAPLRRALRRLPSEFRKSTLSQLGTVHETVLSQRSLTPPEFAQPRLSRSNDGHPQQEGAYLGVFVPIWLVLLKREATSLGVFDLCHFALLKRGCANQGGFGAR